MSESLPDIDEIVDGRYRVVESIGRGGNGVVYRARREAGGEEVALKVLPGDQADPGDLERFRREVFNASGLTHPNTIRLYDYGRTARGDLYIAMEYVPGLDLAEWLDHHGPLSVGNAIDATLQILDSLAEAHRRRIVHRDLKPGNIVIQQTGDPSSPLFVKILDFGLSKFVDGNPNPMEDDLRVTRADRVYGTPQYMAPEQAVGESVTPKTDVYTVGLLAFEMVAGQPAFSGETRRELMRQQIDEELPELPEGVRGTPLREFVRRCTRKDPAERFDDAARAHSWLSVRRRKFGEVEEMLDSTGDDSDLTGAETLAATVAERIDELPLVGRRDELQRLTDWFEETRTSGGVCWLEGAAGLGKSRLVDELLDVTDGETVVLRTTFRRRGSTLRSLRRALEPILDVSDDESPESAPPTVDDDLAREIARELGLEVDDQADPTETLTGPVFEHLRRGLRQVAESKPLLLVLDDLHYAGGLVADLVRRLIRTVREADDPGIRVILAGRSQELRASVDARSIRNELDPDNREGELLLTLDTLSPGETGRLLDYLLPVDEQLRDRLVEQASGNPLYLTQMARYLAEQDLLVEENDDRLQLDDDAPASLGELVPPSLEGLCARRLRMLVGHPERGDALRSLVRRMAILGERFELDLLRRVDDALGGDFDSWEALERLVDMDLVRRASVGGEPGLRFTDPVMRRAVIDGVDDASTYADLHEAAAKAKIEHFDDRPDQQLVSRAREVAKHFEEAGRLARAVDWYRRSARGARERGNVAAAARDLRAAERLLDNYAGSDERSVERLDDIRLAHGELSRLAGEYGPAEDSLRRAVESLSRRSAPEKEARASKELADVLAATAAYEEATSLYERAADGYRRSDRPAEAIGARAGIARIHQLKGQNVQAEETFQSCLEEAKQHDDPHLAAECRLGLGRAFFLSGDLGRARRQFEMAEQAFAGRPRLASETELDLALLSMYEFGPDRAIERARKAIQTKRTIDDLVGLARGHLIAGMALRRTVRIEDAARHAERALRHFERTGHHYGIAKAVLLEAEIAWTRNELDHAAERAGDARQLHRRLEDSHGLALSMMFEALFHNARGRPEEARNLLMRTMALGGQSGLGLYRARSLMYLGLVEESRSNVERADNYFRDALELAREQNNTEAELFAAVNAQKLRLVREDVESDETAFGTLYERADDHGHLFAKAFAAAGDAIFARRLGDESRFDRRVEQARELGVSDSAPYLRIPERLFELAQLISTHRGSSEAAESMRAIADLLERLDAAELADRLHLQVGAISEVEIEASE